MQMEIDRALLTEEQRNQLDMWTALFHGPAWQALVERYEGTIQNLQNSYHQVVGEQALGTVQGRLKTFYDLFVTLPDVIHAEFLLATGQLGAALGEDDGSDDDPVQPEDWRR